MSVDPRPPLVKGWVPAEHHNGCAGIAAARRAPHCAVWQYGKHNRSFGKVIRSRAHLEQLVREKGLTMKDVERTPVPLVNRRLREKPREFS